MLPFFKKPYPYNPLSKKELVRNFLIGVFVAFFLIVFQPFDISLWQTPHKVLKLLGFGFVSFICPMIFKVFLELVAKRSEPGKNWKVWKEVVAFLTALLLIAVGNLLYARLIGIVELGLGDFLLAIFVTFLLAIFPLTANIAMKYNRFLALNQKDAQEIGQELKSYEQRLAESMAQHEEHASHEEPLLLRLIAENERDRLELLPEDLLYIESADNYSNVVYLKNGSPSRQLIRSSLKRLETQIALPYIIRCHRSYMVNIRQIEDVSGNAQGYKLSFKTPGIDPVPVSRNYGPDVLAHLKAAV